MAARIDDLMVLNAAVSKTDLAKYLRDREQVIPQDFGGLGDGVNDDAAAIQACFDRAAADGKFAVIPPGTWNVSGGVVLPSDATTTARRGPAGPAPAVSPVAGARTGPRVARSR